MRRLRCLLGIHRWEFRDEYERIEGPGRAFGPIWTIAIYGRRCHSDEGWLFVNREIAPRHSTLLEQCGLIDWDEELASLLEIRESLE